MNQSKVYLVGAGPGDENLITLKAIECLKEADVVIYDYLANKELLKYCPENCEKIFVGKQASNHTLDQEKINKLLVSKAKQGKTVVRLKGGDPFIFGRGGEEALMLAENNIDFEVVPGITSGVGAPTYAGIPLTQRGETSTLTFITGHEDFSKNESAVNWEQLAKGTGTLVIYMGVENLPLIVSKLVEHGRPADTPIALIRWGTYSCQQVITGTLENITEKAKNLVPPVIIVVGSVVKLREKLNWFEKKPLFGKKIVVTRSRKQASSLSKELSRHGAYIVEFPTIDIKPVKDFSQLDKAIHDISSFSWLIFTSVNGVEIFFSRLFELNYDARILKGIKIAVIGKITGDALAKVGLKPDFVPDSYTSEGTVEAIRKIKNNFSGEKILLPSSDIARDYIANELKKMGADVVYIPVYNNEIPGYTTEYIETVFRDADMVTFTSSSTISNLAEILKIHGKTGLLKNIKGASIGPVTSETARETGIAIVAESKVHTIEALVESIVSYQNKENNIL